MPNNCELVLTKDWNPLYTLETGTLGGCILLLVGANELGGWSLLLVGARKLRSWRFLLIGAGKHIQCNHYIINNIFLWVFTQYLGFHVKILCIVYASYVMMICL